MLVVPLVLLGLVLTSGCLVIDGIGRDRSSDSTTTNDRSAAPTSAKSDAVDPTAQPGFLNDLIDDYNARNTPAIEASKRFDPSLWPTADTAGVLDRDLFETRYNELAAGLGLEPLGGDSGPGEFRFVAERQLTAPGESYPRWVLAHVSTTTGQPLPSASPTTAASPDSPLDAYFAVFVQSGPGEPWLMAVSGWTWMAELPRGPIGTVAAGEDLERASVAALQVRNWLGGSDRVTLDDQLLTEYRSSILTEADGTAHGELGCSAYRPAVHGVPGSPAADNGVYAARAGDTLLVAASYHCIRRFPDNALSWNPPLDQLMGDKELKPHPWVIHILFTRADDGTVRLIGRGGGMVLPEGAHSGADQPGTSEPVTSPLAGI
ncbi:MAG: hypothetical protein CSA84_07430 [Actinomycetales bacterium]|nr:MAG: hypothetical protein CSA84_07430 [Actinomycetales bacterium]